MSWTDERVTLLKKLWGEGKTAAEIAKELGGVTRNAVIGKAHRLSLSNRVSPIQQNKKPVKSVEALPSQTSVKKVPPTKPVVRETNRKRLPLLDLKANMCRWPLGDPRDSNFGFCGDPSISGLPYCADHSKAAYQAATRNRILQAADLEKSLKAEEKKQELRSAAG